MKTILLAVLLLAACGPAYYTGSVPTLITKHGVIVHDQTGALTKSDMDAAEDSMIDSLAGMSWPTQDARGAMLACLARLTVRTEPAEFDCNGNGILCVGVTHGDIGEIVVADMRSQTRCGVQMPYAHELGHYLQGCLDLGNEDSGHTNAPVWGAVMVPSDALYCGR